MSQQPVVSQSTLIPVLHQLDSSQSEAVVGSSSDVASPPRSRRTYNVNKDDSSPAASSESEAEADSRAHVKRPKPRGLVDALSRYFTPSDKRRSRVSLNALPHASPRSLSLQTHSQTSAADTTHIDSTLPPKRRFQRKFRRSSAFGNCEQRHATSLPDSKTYSRKSDTGDFRSARCDSPTSELSPGACLPSELKPEACDLTNVAVSDDKALDGEQRLNTVVANVSAKEEAKKSTNNKQRKRRKTQLSSLHDSLSHFFSADGERKRTPAQYMESEFSFETYQLFDHLSKHVKRQRSSAESQTQSKSLDTANKVEVTESSSITSAAAASWPSACCRSSNYNLSGNMLWWIPNLEILQSWKIVRNENIAKKLLDNLHTQNHQSVGERLLSGNCAFWNSLLVCCGLEIAPCLRNFA